MPQPKRYTITSALPYANGPLHIGHLAGAYLPADIFVRHLRLKGHDVAFICGSDEHGAAILLKALKEQSTPQQIVDTYHAINQKAFADFGITFDIYHRTSDPLHHTTAQEFFLQLHKNGVFTEKQSEQFYDTEYNQFLADRYLSGTCPKCRYEKAYGDQCEKCGSSLSPDDLINPVSTLSGKTPEKRMTSHWYLPMQNYEAWLKEWILEDHKDWKKNVFGQCKSWLDQGLHERAMTRDLNWGVKVPLESADGKVLYVWLDAPIGYISATKAWANSVGKDWEPYWKSNDTSLIHFIGKDNIVFHSIIFPILLKAHGDYILPTNVPANEFMNMEGDKISTSRNWAIWLHEYLLEFPNTEDVLRYVLTSNMPETKDSEFKWKDYQDKCNNELVAVFGNFVNRALVLIHKNYDAKIPAYTPSVDLPLNYTFQDIQARIETSIQEINSFIMQYRFRDAQQSMMEIARIGNKFLADCEPWKLIKTDAVATANVLHIAIYIVGQLFEQAEAFLPFTSQKLRTMLKVQDAKELTVGHQIGEAALLFVKVEDSIIETQLQKLEAIRLSMQAAAPVPTSKPIIQKEAKAEIQFEQFAATDLRTGTIIQAERVPKADKLLQLCVDLGTEQRIIVSGIAEHFKPEAIIGQAVIVVANLAPRKIRGVESHGMLLLAESAEGKLYFVSGPNQLNGLEVR